MAQQNKYAEDLQRSISESAMNQHSLLQKKRTAKSMGASPQEMQAVKLEGVDPSKAQAIPQDNGLNKAAAVANIAQSMGVAPSGGVVGGALSGAASGAAFGAPGAAVGAVTGAVMGAAQAAAARKAQNAKIEAEKHQAMGRIEQDKGRQLNNALAGMGQRMSIR